MAKKKASTKGTAAQKPAVKKQEGPKKVNDPVGRFTEEELREFHTKCGNLARDIRKRAAEMTDAKAEAKYATESYNSATEGLTKYISGFKELPLFPVNQQQQQELKPEPKDAWKLVALRRQGSLTKR